MKTYGTFLNNQWTRSIRDELDPFAAANAAFAPDANEVAAARSIIAAYEQARAQGKGVVVVNGRLVENLHVEEAQRQLAMAEAIARVG